MDHSSNIWRTEKGSFVIIFKRVRIITERPVRTTRLNAYKRLLKFDTDAVCEKL
jgi:hypothetical protein